MRELKKNPSIKKTRLLNPNNPSGGGKDFYHKRIYDELAKYYTPLHARGVPATAKPQVTH
jgi:hypothetical protein